MTITDRQRAAIRRLAERMHLVFVILYGSTATGVARENSDVDIAVLSEKTPDYTLFGTLFNEISDVFRGMNVDLRFLNGTDPFFSMQVVQNGILLAGDQEQYDDFRALTNRRYIDDGMKYFPALDEHLHAQQEYLERVPR